eukprot:2848735-Rhodomonas_salina.2
MGKRSRRARATRPPCSSPPRATAQVPASSPCTISYVRFAHCLGRPTNLLVTSTGCVWTRHGPRCDVRTPDMDRLSRVAQARPRKSSTKRACSSRTTKVSGLLAVCTNGDEWYRPSL